MPEIEPEDKKPATESESVAEKLYTYEELCNFNPDARKRDEAVSKDRPCPPAEPAGIEPRGVAQPAAGRDSAKPAAQTLQDNLGDSPQPEVAAAASTNTPHDWAQYFIQRCGYRLDQAITPKTMVMFREWIAEGIAHEDVEDAALAAEAKLGGYPDTPMYYRGFVAEVAREKRRAKENPGARWDSTPGSMNKTRKN